jgi:hypothetical protein
MYVRQLTGISREGVESPSPPWPRTEGSGDGVSGATGATGQLGRPINRTNRRPEYSCPRASGHGFRNKSGNLAILAAIRRASWVAGSGGGDPQDHPHLINAATDWAILAAILRVSSFLSNLAVDRGLSRTLLALFFTDAGVSALTSGTRLLFPHCTLSVLRGRSPASVLPSGK